MSHYYKRNHYYYAMKNFTGLFTIFLDYTERLVNYITENS